MKLFRAILLGSLLAAAAALQTSAESEPPETVDQAGDELDCEGESERCYTCEERVLCSLLR